MRAYDFEYQIDGRPMLVPDAGVGISFTDLDADDTGRDESGYMHREVLRERVRTWSFSYAFLTHEEYQYIMSLFSGKPTFTFYEGSSSITADTLASVYGFLPGDGVSDADFSEVTWNTCKTGAKYEGLYRGGATFVYKDKALGEVEVVKTNEKITFILSYSNIKQFICTEEGDNYGILVMGFDFKVGSVKFASMENTTYDIPKVDFVYGGDYSENN